MSFNSFFSRLIGIVLAVFLTSCGGGGSSATPPVGGLTATASGGRVTLTWAAEPGVTYWLLWAPTSAALDMDHPPAVHTWVTAVTSPYVLTGLTNGTTYAFAINGRTGNGPGGAQTPTQFAVPRPAGGTWNAVTSNGGATVNFKSLMVGTDSSAATDYIAVGDSGIFYSTDSQTWTLDSSANAVGKAFTSSIYALSTFFASTSSAPYVYTSTLPGTWTAPTTAPSGAVNALASNGSRVVGVGPAQTYYSDDTGVTWQTGTINGAAPANLNAVTYNSTLGLWVAVGTNGAVLTSPDGATWTAGTAAASQTLNGVYSYGSYVIAVGEAGTVTLSSSSSGLSWSSPATTVPSGGAVSLKAVTYDGTQFVAVGSGGAVYSSTDGAMWVNQTSLSSASTGSRTSQDLYAVLGTQVSYVAAGNAGTLIGSQ